MIDVVVREHARLTCEPTNRAPSLDEAVVAETAFDWLCAESERLRSGGAALVQTEGRRWLRLDNYVGVVETPCGTRIEILPKHIDELSPAAGVDARRLLERMLATCLDVAPRVSSDASLRVFDVPITEWVVREFLDALDRLVKRGVRFDYRRVRAEESFLRGRLDVARQMRQSPARAHYFRLEHDVFDADRAENRLLKSALARVLDFTRDTGNWRLARELLGLFADVPPSTDTASDFRRWRTDRLMAHYRPVRPWCSLILDERVPLAFAGAWRGRSLLFPMERLFERYVYACLRGGLPSDVVIHRQAGGKYLCRHAGNDLFALRPDLLLEKDGLRYVMDTKWKVLDASRGPPYDLGIGDFYQLFAYGSHFLESGGDVFLIFPKTPRFDAPLPVFEFSSGLRLWVVPFDLYGGAVPQSIRDKLEIRSRAGDARSPVRFRASRMAN
jgi:5-methylcytosine-specific restriction enzyme subunit McrC